jgi:hypothetical protein
MALGDKGDSKRRRVARRASVLSVAWLERLFGEVVIAVLGAFLAAWYQATHQAQTPTHLLLAASFPDLVIAALLGGLGAVLLVRGVFWLVACAVYPLRRWKDGEWEARLTVPNKNIEIMLVELASTRDPPLDPETTLGHVECLVTDPAGQERMAQFLRASDGVISAPHETHMVRGTYEVRWYGTNKQHKQYEITRRRFAVGTDGW